MGWNSQPTRALIFEDAEVPAENVIGSLGQVSVLKKETSSLHKGTSLAQDKTSLLHLILCTIIRHDNYL